MPKGRPIKPLSQKVLEGGRLRNDRINRDAPIPPAGRPEPPRALTEMEMVIWNLTLELAAPGQIRPLDGVLLARYAWTLAETFKAMKDLEEWRGLRKKDGETDQLVKARNGELIAHPLYSLIDRHQKQLDRQEAALGLNPVSRERIRASLQADLFDIDRDFDEYSPRPAGVH
jgi:phage terminase small subunit